jgi:phosphoribosylformylglycinamidine cyclo-ligase
MKYSDSGVDIDRSNEAKRRIKSLIRSTFTEAVVGDIGAFGGMYRPDFLSLQKPILVSSADGVGTKLKVAFLSGIHDTVGIDLVSHCTNDILVQGAFPLFFLDYIASGRVEPAVIEQLVKGLAEGCKQSQCVLIGGETAEMPDFYQAGEYDLAGFIVGVVDESKLLGSRKVEKGDILIGLRSSGLHTNGYSLARKIFFEQEKLRVDSYVDFLGRTAAEELLEPHRNYLPVVRELVHSDDLHAMAHITGGGITENLDRVLGPNLDGAVQRGSWEILRVFRFLRERGQVEDDEMYRTFNMGIGLILVVAKDRLARVEDYLRTQNEQYYLIGEVVEGTGKVRYV